MIPAQQARVRARYPDTPVGELKLLPSPRANPDGRRPITWRHWKTGTGTGSTA